jgi:cytoskeletal protein CcmA (bactofilin family)
VISNQNPVRGLVVATIPADLTITGEVLSSDDLLVEGTIRGDVFVPAAMVTIAKEAVVDADIRGKVVLIYGAVRGTISASERIDIGSSASVTGNVSADHVVISDGAVVNGHIDMNRRTIASRVLRHQTTATSALAAGAPV